MPIFYLREKTSAILNQKEYDNVPHHNPATDNYRILGDFDSKSQARQYYRTALEGNDNESDT